MDQIVKTDVLIVGAGPTGLALACQLSRYGIDSLIIETNKSITPFSKAIGVQARTLEIYEQLDLAEKAVEQGTIAGKGRLIVAGEVRGEIEVSQLGQDLSPYPFVLMLEQSKNERLLYDYLKSQGREVTWQTTLKSLSQNESHVIAKVESEEGLSQTIQARYLVGCDGPKSLTRHALGLSFAGSTFERTFYVADAKVDWGFSHDAVHICLSPESFVVFFPLKGESRYRIVGVFPEEFAKSPDEVMYEEIEARIKEEAKLQLEIRDVEWFSTYKVHTRHVNRFSEGRCFLAGDAAHIHSPAGAQGMNTGIQDSYNLAWKLAFVLKDRADEKLLETYNEERLENADHLLKTTDRIFELVAGADWLLAFVRMNVFPPLAKYILNFDLVKRNLFPLLSQIGINYRADSLSRHGDDDRFHVKAGDRMPYFLVDGKSIYEKLRQPKFHLLSFSKSRAEFEGVAAELREFSDLFDFEVLSLSPKVTEVFGTDNTFSVLLRPDNYIGFISKRSLVAELRSYFTDQVFLKTPL